MRSIFEILLRFLVLFCLLELFTASGCLKGPLEKNAGHLGKWVCDTEADEAMMRHDYETAISLHERFLKKNPSNALALYHMGYAYGHLGDLEKEVSLYEKAIALGFEENHILYNLGMAYGEMNRFHESIEAFRKAIEMSPNDAESRFGLAMAYLQIGNEELAEKELLRAIRIDPEHVEARWLLLQLYLDRYEPAEEKEHIFPSISL